MGAPRNAPRNLDDVLAMQHRNAELAQQESEGGAVPVHFLVSWDTSGTVLEYQELRQMLMECELGYLYTPPIRTSSALLRALKAMTEDELIRVAFDDQEETVWQVLRLHRGTKENPEIWVSRGAMVTYHKKAKAGEETVTYSSSDVRDRIEPLLQHYATSYLPGDIAFRVLTPAIRGVGGFAWRRQGGVYFVPAPGGEVVAKLEKFIDAVAAKVNGRAHLSAMELPDNGNEKTQGNIRWHSYQALVAELRGSERKLRDMLRKDRTDEHGQSKVAAKTVAGYLHEVDELGKEAKLMQQIAQLGIEDIQTALQALGAVYTEVMTGGISLADFDGAKARVDAAITKVEKTLPHKEGEEGEKEGGVEEE